MARFFTALAVLAVLIQGGQSSTPNGIFDEPSVECNSLGFKPTFTYNTQNEEHDLLIEIDIGGTGSLNENCHANHSDSNLNGTHTFTFDHFGDHTGQISYTNSTNGVRCGGTFEHWIDISNSNTEYIRYQVNVSAVVTRTFRGKIERKTQYPFVITCKLERKLDGVSTNNSFEVLEQLVDAAATDEAEGSFNFEAFIKFQTNDSYVEELTDSVVRPRNNEKLYLEVSQGADQDLFKFVVNKCYATRGSSANPGDPLDKDVFFEDQCHVDETVIFGAGTDGEFQFSILSFSFPNPTDTIFFHCDLYVCLATNTTTPCMQKTQNYCNNQAKRRRRSVEGVDYDYAKTITAAQPVLFESAQVHTPSCGEGFVYDRELDICSRENLLEVRHVRLSQDIWRPEYANTSSSAFKELAKTKEFQLWVLLMTTGQNRIIHGVKVLRARKGSVIMDLAIKYSDSVTAEQAFTAFRQVLYTPTSTTRVQKILQITHEKSIEYVPFVPRGSEKADTEKLILIVVVVVLFVVVFIAGVTLFKVKQVRQTSTTRPATGFDNKGVDA